MKVCISKKDLRRETFRSGGKGGQNQNKVETGVRYTHLPTGITAESRDERKQGQNNEIALERLVEKIREFYQRHVRQEAAARYDAKPDVAFGRQIRSYVLCGKNQRVVDHRTGEEYNPEKVLNGQLPPPCLK